MNIIKFIRQHRRDFTAIYKCEHCGHEEEGKGYNDSYFHNKVIPEMKCKKCGKTVSDNYRPLTTKYADGVTV